MGVVRWPAVPGQLGALWPVAVLGVAVVAVAVAVRLVVVRPALGRRVPLVVLLPTESFDPSVEEVGRFAAECLGRRGRGVRRAGGLRVRLSAVDGELTYRLEGPPGAGSSLRLGGLREVEAVAA